MSAEPAPRHATRQLALLSVAMILAMTPWFSATVAAPGMIAEWGVAPTEAAWLTIAVQAGFVLGTLASALLLLSDRFRARLLAALSCGVVGGATALLVWRDTGPILAIGLRALTGAALAGVYPPGIKIAAGWWRSRRGTAIGILVGALTVGSAAPSLLRAVLTTDDWRTVVLVSAGAAVLAGFMFAVVIREGPYQAAAAPFDVHALSKVIRDRSVMLATAGYLGHMWELYAMWSSIGAFWAYIVTARALSATIAPLLSFVTIGAGTAGCIIAGIVADRVGRATVTIVSMAVSGMCAILIGLLIDAPLILLILVAVAWGVSIVADSAQFSAAVTELAPLQYVGTAVTLQTCAGFLLTIASIRMVPLWVAQWGWSVAYAPLAVGPALGIIAMWKLRTRTVAQQS